jgi:hypothetical protein
MWKHDCKIEGTIIMIGNGEKCNWCGHSFDYEHNEFDRTDKALDNETPEPDKEE